MGLNQKTFRYNQYQAEVFFKNHQMELQEERRIGDLPIPGDAFERIKSHSQRTNSEYKKGYMISQADIF
jgi:hypothetical protein